MQFRLLVLATSVAMTGFAGVRSSASVTVTSKPETTSAIATPVAPLQPLTNALSERDELVQAALTALGSSATNLSRDNALELAFRAYYTFKAAHPDEVQKPYLYFVDYGLDNRTARGYVFDMDKLELVDGPFRVAHGKGSSKGDGVPTRFSNRAGASTTSLGLYVTGETYGFSGHASGHLYHSIGLRMDGKSGQFNSAARARGVVMHGAPYVTSVRAGKSQGCPAVDPSRARRLIPMLANGSVIFLYSPRDATWLEQDPWING
jgi:hypothetical protein